MQKRFDYFDALRGVAMLNVIYFHICAYLLGETTAISNSIIRWQMPLFFFISGFFAVIPHCDVPLIKRKLIKRLFKQLYPTVAVWLLFNLCCCLVSDVSLKEQLLHGIYDSAKLGYWFTFSLMQVFVIYTIVFFLLSYFKVSVRQQTLFYFIIIVFFIWLSIIDNVPFKDIQKWIWNVLSFSNTIKIIAFFFAGVLARMHWQRVCNLFRHYWFTLICLFVFVLFSFSTPSAEESNAVVYLISRVSGLAFMVSLFLICSQRFVFYVIKLNRYLQYIGRNTLPIYLFHFFILLLVSHFIEETDLLLRYLSSNMIVEFISFTAISIIIAEIALTIDRLLKKVPCVYKILFPGFEYTSVRKHL